MAAMLVMLGALFALIAFAGIAERVVPDSVVDKLLRALRMD